MQVPAVNLILRLFPLPACTGGGAGSGSSHISSVRLLAACMPFLRVGTQLTVQ
jgi:hypothetical protein